MLTVKSPKMFDNHQKRCYHSVRRRQAEYSAYIYDATITGMGLSTDSSPNAIKGDGYEDCKE
jgi:hypothetical protein